MYGGAKLKVWQVVVLGALSIALGIVLHLTFGWDAANQVHYRSMRTEGVSQIFFALKLWISVPVAIGVWHWWRAYEVVVAGRAATAAATAAAEPTPEPRKLEAAPLPPPPRLGDDPFREPPRAAPIVVQRHESQPAPAPIVPGDPDDKPKLLT